MKCVDPTTRDSGLIEAQDTRFLPTWRNLGWMQCSEVDLDGSREPACLPQSGGVPTASWLVWVTELQRSAPGHVPHIGATRALPALITSSLGRWSVECHRGEDACVLTGPVSRLCPQLTPVPLPTAGSHLAMSLILFSLSSCRGSASCFVCFSGPSETISPRRCSTFRGGVGL